MSLVRYTTHFIDNVFVAPSPDSKWITTTDPCTGQEIACVPSGSDADVDAAVRAAARAGAAGGAWSAMDGAARGALLLRLAALMERDADALAAIEALDTGKPLRVARGADVASAIRVLRHHASLADVAGAGGGRVLGAPLGAVPAPALALTLEAPVGVVAGIVPFNFPLCGAAAKLAPALAAGCTLVLKPPHQAPLSALALAALVREAGCPAGVVNVLCGAAATGAALVAHAAVRKVSFTGSVAAGRAVGAAAAARCARVTLELGGKNAFVVAPDFADMAEAARVAAGANFYNAGQICVATSRVLVPAARRDEFVAAAVRCARARTLGDPWDAATDMGPLIDDRQVERVLDYVAAGVAAGATLECGGVRARASTGGCFVEPTVLSNVDDANVVACEEIFGPVMCVQTYEGSVDAAFERANATNYGLAAVVLTNDVGTALRAARALHAGTVWINTHGVFDPAVPYGGLKESGIGKEYGREGLAAYLETRTVVFAPPKV